MPVQARAAGDRQAARESDRAADQVVAPWSVPTQRARSWVHVYFRRERLPGAHPQMDVDRGVNRSSERAPTVEVLPAATRTVQVTALAEFDRPRDSRPRRGGRGGRNDARRNQER